MRDANLNSNTNVMMIDSVKTRETSTSPRKIDKTADCVTRCSMLQNTKYSYRYAFRYVRQILSYVYTALCVHTVEKFSANAAPPSPL